MPVLTMPDIAPSVFSLQVEANAVHYESPISRLSQDKVGLGDRWVGNLVWTHKKREKLAPMIAFVAALGGTAGRFTMPHWAHRTPLGSPSGTASGSLGADAWTLSTSGFGGMPAVGDVISVNGELKMVTSVSGSTLGIAPSLRSGGGSIVYSDPMGTFRLADNQQGMPEYSGCDFVTLSLSIVEAL